MNKKKLFESALWLVGGKTLVSAFNFLVNIICVWYISPEEFGEFAIVSANISLFTGILNFRLGDLILTTSKADFNKKVDLYFSLLTLQQIFLFFIVVSVLLLFNLNSINAFILIIGTLSTQFVDYFTRIYERKFDYKHISKIETFSAFGAGILTILFLTFDFGESVLYLRNLLIVLFTMAFLYFSGQIFKVKYSKIKISDLKVLSIDIRGLWIDNLMENLYARLLTYLTYILGGERLTGFYFQAQKLILLFNQILSPLTSRLALNYFSNGIENHLKLIKLKLILKYQAIFFILASIIAYFSSEIIIDLAYGKEWSGVVPLFKFMIGFMAFNTLFETFKSYYIAKNEYWGILVLGRIPQFIVLIASVLVFDILGLNHGESISLGVSLGFGISVLLVYLYTYHLKNSDQLVKK
jgi:O-antigen/teichoic acid export membrane protein